MKGRWETYDVAWPASCLDSLNHLRYFKNTTWKKVSPETAAQFSAVAYYYGKMLRDSLKVPVGLICNAIGGAPTEAWVDRNTLETQFPAILKDWLHNDFIQDWVRGRAAKISPTMLHISVVIHTSHVISTRVVSCLCSSILSRE